MNEYSSAEHLRPVVFVDPEKLVKTYEIQNIKFFEGIKFNNIICRITKDLIIIGGCLGHVHLINLNSLLEHLLLNASINFIFFYLFEIRIYIYHRL